MMNEDLKSIENYKTKVQIATLIMEKIFNEKSIFELDTLIEENTTEKQKDLQIS